MGRIVNCKENLKIKQIPITYAFKKAENKGAVQLAIGLRFRRHSNTEYNVTIDVNLVVVDRTNTIAYQHKQPFHIVVTTEGGAPFEHGITDNVVKSLLPVLAWAVNGQIINSALINHQNQDERAPKGFAIDPLSDQDLINCIRLIRPTNEDPTLN